MQEDQIKRIHDIIQMARDSRMQVSDQLTVGKLIAKLEPIVANQKNRTQDEATVVYDFGSLFPTEIDSWRGAYQELALNYTDEGLEMTVTKFLELIKSTIGQTFEGYKGGDFVMHENTPLWVANNGRSGNTALFDVMDDGWRVVLITGYNEY